LPLVLCSFYLFQCIAHPRALHSFPTRRSSDLDYAAVRGAPGRVGGGVEVGLADPATQLLVVARLGVASRAGGDFATRPVTLGVGLRFRQVALDYAYAGSELLGSQHRLGLTFADR